ncbi:hypothetical protein [Flavobacterium subsaxonicum]|uniref:Phenylalanyl-tRNA synthetase subunit alpha n=1 Tax=Flavobacterium subsaxonicum WB 4.1-42 = DSM 21790 TaxID=1121898 RepID=A0A0A2MJN5_9FLAO|nr:hypothetical protein [Flavobacterium subsaxonicum]KGO91796.1 phenylalanyl-tRNA synthetase subunit alpha [Flavobacterium subsaxonicum WB 4.1-42 = DSM 21790]
MKKDIIIPQVENVYVAAVQEWNDDLMSKTWYAYLVNDSDFTLETVIVVSNASGMLNGEERKTSMLRHAFVEVPPVTAVKIEMIEDSVLVLDNSFMVTYFIGNTLYDKNFIFKAGTINEADVEEVPVIWKDGIMIG